MSGFYYAYSSDGSKELKKPMYVPAASVLEKGEIVLFTPGTGIAAVSGTDFDDPACGVSYEGHDGSTSGRQSETELMVNASPSSVFGHKCRNVITATGGGVTTFVVSGLLPQTDDLWIGGYLEVLTCAADSTMVKKRIKITDSTGSSGTLTFATQPAAFASGDTAYLCPGPLAITEYGWDLDADGMNVDWDTDGGSALTLFDVDPANMLSFWKFRLHQFGNYAKTLD